MKRYNYIALIVTFVLCIPFGSLLAQTSYTVQISVDNQSISKMGNITAVEIDVNISQLNLDKNDLLLITPTIVSNSSGEKAQLEPFAVKGRVRGRILDRPFEWEGKTELTMPEAKQIVRKNNTSQSLRYQTTLPYSLWQRDASLIFHTEVIGCADCQDHLPSTVMIPKILPDLYVPAYRFAYLTPDVEEIKARKDSFSAYLNYVVGRWDLLPNFENNAAELAKVDNSIKELQADKDLTITDFTISGYASPEDTRERNMLRSQRRAETLANYIEEKYGYTSNQFKVEWFGEDWDSLREAVSASSLPNKGAILKVIDSEPDFDARDARLIALDNGATYNKLLREFYPPLRRNEYHISFVSRGFSIDETAGVLQSRPKLLSLNEMFLLAKTYPEDSPKYKEVFDIAANTFPGDATANINAAVGELRANNPDAALERLNKVENNATGWNLTDIAYSMKGELDKAKVYFTRAVNGRHPDAKHNLDQLNRLIEDI